MCCGHIHSLYLIKHTWFQLLDTSNSPINRFGGPLQAVVTATDDLASQAAAAADSLLQQLQAAGGQGGAAGGASQNESSLLLGIPYGDEVGVLAAAANWRCFHHALLHRTPRPAWTRTSLQPQPGLKDIFATPGHPTAWGVAALQNMTIEQVGSTLAGTSCLANIKQLTACIRALLLSHQSSQTPKLFVHQRSAIDPVITRFNHASRPGCSGL